MSSQSAIRRGSSFLLPKKTTLNCHISRRENVSKSLAPLTKIQSLFTHRQVIAQARLDLDEDAYKEWLKQATQIQTSIYSIDDYYERSKSIETRVENPMWLATEEHLRANPASGASGIWSAYTDLKYYADAERRIHISDFIDPREFETILPLKCSDVRIARTLIWSYSSKPLSSAEIKFWSLYDQCWELLEDAIDLDEDGKDWNFNFWLYPFMMGGVTVNCVQQVTLLLQRKLHELELACQHLPSNIRPFGEKLYAHTLSCSTVTDHLEKRVIAAVEAGGVKFFEELT